MPPHEFRDFEHTLAQLKQAKDQGRLSIDKYIEQAGELRFQDEAAGKEYWLDAESETWYAAPLGTNDFELFTPPAVPATESLPEPMEEVIPTVVQEKAHSRSEPSGTLPIESTTSSQPTNYPQQNTSSNETPSLPPSSTITWKPWMGIGVVILLLVLSFGGITLFLSTKVTETSSVTTAASNPSPLAITTATFTPIPPSPTSTATATASPTAIIAVPPTVSFSPTPTVTSEPTDLPTATQQPVSEATKEPESPTSIPLIPTETNTPTPLPLFSGRLAYPEYRSEAGTFDVKVIDLATKEEIITISRASQPALSPNGAKLAYISWTSDSVGLYSLSLNNSQSPNTIGRSHYAQRPRWGFDETAIVFEEIQNERKDIRFNDSDGVPNLEQAQTPTWTPDGWLVVQACRGTSCGLATVQPNGTEFRFLTHRTSDIAPTVSPDGQWIAYTSEQDGNWDVWLVSIDGGEPARLTTTPTRDGIPTWSPDGNWLAFAAENQGSWSIDAIRPDGSERQILVNLTGSLDSEVTLEKYRQLGWLHESISWSQ